MTSDITRELLGKIVDEVFDGGLEDTSVVEDIYRVIKREEAALSTPNPGDADGCEDTARLDWLDTVNIRSNGRNKTVYGWKYDINHNRAALTDCNLPALTVREAIDAARFPDRASEITLKSHREQQRRADFDRKQEERRAASSLREGEGA